MKKAVAALSHSFGPTLKWHHQATGTRSTPTGISSEASGKCGRLLAALSPTSAPIALEIASPAIVESSGRQFFRSDGYRCLKQ